MPCPTHHGQRRRCGRCHQSTQPLGAWPTPGGCRRARRDHRRQLRSPPPSPAARAAAPRAAARRTVCARARHRRQRMVLRHAPPRPTRAGSVSQARGPCRRQPMSRHRSNPVLRARRAARWPTGFHPRRGRRGRRPLPDQAGEGPAAPQSKSPFGAVAHLQHLGQSCPPVGMRLPAAEPACLASGQAPLQAQSPASLRPAPSGAARRRVPWRAGDRRASPPRLLAGAAQAAARPLSAAQTLAAPRPEGPRPRSLPAAIQPGGHWDYPAAFVAGSVAAMKQGPQYPQVCGRRRSRAEHQQRAASRFCAGFRRGLLPVRRRCGPAALAGPISPAPAKRMPDQAPRGGHQRYPGTYGGRRRAGWYPLRGHSQVPHHELPRSSAKELLLAARPPPGPRATPETLSRLRG